MSRWTTLRRFREETGSSPMAWLVDARIDRARQLLEATATPVERTGRLTGLGAPASVRGTFHRHLGTSPREYRAMLLHRALAAPAERRERGRAAVGTHAGARTPVRLYARTPVRLYGRTAKSPRGNRGSPCGVRTALWAPP
ncbi:helix-turn-helix domain-containing protein [Streptomyces sp. NPDC101237]|uniref:helix-turn-helix domain-containing protein n=1 Tax=Streptomyces sp. NPDC101237 TaxID=3366139 RepID=UPI0038021808